MSDKSSGIVEPPRQVSRVVGRLRGDTAGPMLIALAGIHGNEHAGVEAVRNVLGRLQDGIEIKGDFAVLAGNLRALGSNARFIDRDLNRQWTPEVLARLARSGSTWTLSNGRLNAT